MAARAILAGNARAAWRAHIAISPVLSPHVCFDVAVGATEEAPSKGQEREDPGLCPPAAGGSRSRRRLSSCPSRRSPSCHVSSFSTSCARRSRGSFAREPARSPCGLRSRWQHAVARGSSRRFSRLPRRRSCHHRGSFRTLPRPSATCSVSRDDAWPRARVASRQLRARRTCIRSGIDGEEQAEVRAASCFARSAMTLFGLRVSESE